MTGLIKNWRFLLFLFSCLLFSGCSTVDTNNGDTTRPPESAAPAADISSDHQLGVSVRLFTRATPANEIHDLEATLFSINLKQTLEQSGHWQSVRLKPASDNSDQLVVEGSITSSDGDQSAVSIKISDNSGFVRINNHYEATIDSGVEQLFHHISELINKDLIKTEQNLSEKQVKTIINNSAESSLQALHPLLANNNNEPGAVSAKHLKTLAGYDNLMLEAVAANYAVYYDDLIKPFAQFHQAEAQDSDSLIRLEREVTSRQLTGVGVVAEAIIRSILPEQKSGGKAVAKPMDLLLTDKRLSPYSNFQPWQDYTDSVSKAADLGVSINKEKYPQLLDTASGTYVLSDSVEQQYSRWRTMIIETYLEYKAVSSTP